MASNKFLKNNFGLLALLIVGIFFTINDAKATDNVYLDNGNGTTYNASSSLFTSAGGGADIIVSNTINASCGNSYMVVFVRGGWYGETFTNYAYDGVAMADIGIGNINWFLGYQNHAQYFVLKNPHTGTKNFYVHNSAYGTSNDVVIQTFCNVDQTTPLEKLIHTTAGNTTTVDSGYFGFAYDNSYIAVQDSVNINSTSTITTPASGFSILTTVYNSPRNTKTTLSYDEISVARATSSPDYYHIINTSGANPVGRDQVIYVLKYSPAVWCGDGICQTATENCSTCASDCGTCAGNPPDYTYSGQILFGFELPYTCSNISTCKINYSYNQDVFTQYDYVETRQLPFLGATSSTFVSTSTIFDVLGTSYLGKGNGISYFTLPGTTTVSGLTDYLLIGHLAPYFDAVNSVYVEATTTIMYIFQVNWYGGNLVWDITDIMNSTTTNPLDVDTHALACSDADWNSTSTYLGINFQVAICKTYQFTLDAGLKPINYIKGKLVGVRNSILNMFPFSLFKTVRDAWTALIVPNIAYASDFNTSTGIIASSSFSFDIGNFLGTTGTTTINLFSKAGLIDAMGQNVFNIYYYFVKFLVWGLLFNYWWHLIVNRSHEELTN